MRYALIFIFLVGCVGAVNVQPPESIIEVPVYLEATVAPSAIEDDCTQQGNYRYSGGCH